MIDINSEQYCNCEFNNITCTNDCYEKLSTYVKGTMINRRFIQFANEKKLLDLLLYYDNDNSLSINFHDIYSGIAKLLNNKDAFIASSCPKKPFHHCQSHYLLLYDGEKKELSRYHRQTYLYHNSIDFTAVMHTSYDRINRIDYLLNRWPGKICVSLFIIDNNFIRMKNVLKKYGDISRLILIFYIPISNSSSYYLNNGTVIKKERTTYPLNFLRDLSIESISTTHYVLLDADILTSSTLYSNLKRHIDVLNNDSNIILFQTFQTTRDYGNECRNTGNCKIVWDSIPNTKFELLEYLRSGLIEPYGSKYHKIVNIFSWINSKNNQLFLFHPISEIEPYGVFRRSVKNPIFNPLFIDYGYDKVEYYQRLVIDSFSFFVLSDDFGVDIPHPRTITAVEYTYERLRGENLMKSQYRIFKSSYELFYHKY